MEEKKDRLRIAYSGVEGAYAHIAVRRIYRDAYPVSCLDFQSAYEAVENGEARHCVLPIENSYAGEVGQVTDLMLRGSLHVTSMYSLPVIHHLMGLPGSELSWIKRVISHPQAISQCAGYIRRRGLEVIQTSNTARAAQYVMEHSDPELAAIASFETASLYGLRVLDRGINDSGLNSTRFGVFSREEGPDTGDAAAGFMILFTVNHEAGALAGAVTVIGKYGFNMRVLRSRPMGDLPWHYYFFAELEGDDRSEAGQSMMAELTKYCNFVKLVGRYGPETDLGEEA